MKKWITIGGGILFMFLFLLYIYFPRNEEPVTDYLAYDNQLEDNCVYLAELQIYEQIISISYTSNEYSGTIKECAVMAIRDEANRNAISLPDHFEDDIRIDNVTTDYFRRLKIEYENNQANS